MPTQRPSTPDLDKMSHVLVNWNSDEDHLMQNCGTVLIKHGL